MALMREFDLASHVLAFEWEQLTLFHLSFSQTIGTAVGMPSMSTSVKRKLQDARSNNAKAGPGPTTQMNQNRVLDESSDEEESRSSVVKSKKAKPATVVNSGSNKKKIRHEQEQPQQLRRDHISVDTALSSPPKNPFKLPDVTALHASRIKQGLLFPSNSPTPPADLPPASVPATTPPPGSAAPEPSSTNSTPMSLSKSQRKKLRKREKKAAAAAEAGASKDEVES
jgi:hypothetical protein